MGAVAKRFVIVVGKSPGLSQALGYQPGVHV